LAERRAHFAPRRWAPVAVALGHPGQEGVADRAEVQRFGPLTVRIASRIDQIAFKLYAAADHWPLRGKHLQDLQALTPTVVELVDAARWCRTHDPSVGFRDVQLGPVLGLFDVGLDDV